MLNLFDKQTILDGAHNHVAWENIKCCRVHQLPTILKTKYGGEFVVTGSTGGCRKTIPVPHVCLIHHDLKKLQEILDVTNHVANKYHIQFGAAKCKVIKLGKGKKSNLKLNGETLEEVQAYKYLGETINNKGTLADHITEIEKKVKGATASIIAETGNSEFKGIKMQAIWKMVDAIITPIITYACEGWTINKKEKNKLQSIFNDSLKTLLHLPKGTPTTILLNETGNIPIEYLLKKKLILQAKRIAMMKEESLVKDITEDESSSWKKRTEEVAKEFHVHEQMYVISKEALKHQVCKEIESKVQEEIENEAETKSKINHWKVRKESIEIGVRPKYMDKLNRKQCNAILRARASMLMTKSNYKKIHETNLLCRFCKKSEETQEHILQDCLKIDRTMGKIEYNRIFEDEIGPLKEIAESIIKIEEILRNPNLPCMSSSDPSEPPG